MMDAAIEDDHGRAIDRLAVDHAGQVRARRADEEPAGFEQQAGVTEQRVRRPVGDDRSRGPLPAGRGRAIPRAPRTGCRGRRRHRRAERSCRSPGRGVGAARTVAATWATSAAASRTFEAPNACRPSSSRCGDVAARRAEAAEISARPSRTCRRRRRRRAGPVRVGRPPSPRRAAGQVGAGRQSRRSPRVVPARRVIRRSRRGSRP